MKHWTAPLTAVAAVAFIAGCATPLPDGSRIQRLPQSASPPASLSDEESRALTQLNARLLAEQEEARRREAELATLRQRDADIHWGLHFGYGWPYRRHHGWFWTGTHWTWRPY